jgi:regulator of replication initiation timing
MLEGFDFGKVQDLGSARECIKQLLNLVEELKAAVDELRAENQSLRDEINRLKGEQGKPKIRPNTKEKSTSRDWSSEKERHEAREHTKRGKLDSIKIDRTEELEVDQGLLPRDAEFKGYEEVVVQDVKIQTDTILFRRKKYYSASEGKSYVAPLPPGYEGEFGPAVKAWALTLYFGCNISEPKVLEFLREAGIVISSGEVSNLLIKQQDRFHAEKDAVYEAGLRSSPWQQIDDTGMRVNGQNQYCQVLCNPLYTAYFTTGDKTRQTVLDVLMNFRNRTFLLNEEAFRHFERVMLARPVVAALRGFPQERVMSEGEFLGLLGERLPALGPHQLARILDGAGVAAYHVQKDFPVVQLLLCDDAKQFKSVTDELALCWVHDGRNYKKLLPAIKYHQELLDAFLDRYWAFYRRLRDYQAAPTASFRAKLEEEFDELFSTQTGYYALDARIDTTQDNKENLLKVLEHPEIPLHNNSPELGARQRVRKRDVSFGTRTKEGTRAWDTFMTLAATARKLGISFCKYLYDRISGSYLMPSLAEVITQRAQQLSLGASWNQGP